MKAYDNIVFSVGGVRCWRETARWSVMSTEMPAIQIQQRTVLAMLNEAVRCLSDGIIRSPRDGDVGAVFGIGFPPFRGGPFRYMDTVGIQIVVQRLEDLNARFPGRFEPAEMLLEMARHRQNFYSDERS